MFKMFHGTTFDGASKIPFFGFDSSHNKAWSCSDEEMVYFYNPVIILNSGETETEEEADNWCLERANEQGQIQNALLDEPFTTTCVLEFQFNDDVLNLFENDMSCDGIFGASQIDLEEVNYIIRKRQCKIIAHYFQFYPKLSIFYLTGLKNNPYFTEAFENMKEIDRVALEIACNSGDTYEIYEAIISQDEIEGLRETWF